VNAQELIAEARRVGVMPIAQGQNALGAAIRLATSLAMELEIAEGRVERELAINAKLRSEPVNAALREDNERLRAAIARALTAGEVGTEIRVRVILNEALIEHPTPSSGNLDPSLPVGEASESSPHMHQSTSSEPPESPSRDPQSAAGGTSCPDCGKEGIITCCQKCGWGF